MAIRIAGSGTRSFFDRAASASRVRAGVPRPNSRLNGAPVAKRGAGFPRG